MSSLQEISGRKRHARNLYKSLIESKDLAGLSADYVGPTGLTRRDIIEKIERLGSCGSQLYLAELQSGKIKIHKGDFCKQHIVCGTCAARIQNLRRKRFAPAILDLAKRADPKYRGEDRLYVYLITFTVPDGPGILETHKRLKAAMKNFRKMGQDRPIYRKGQRVGTRRGHGEWGKVIAAVGTHEIIRGDGSGETHSHCHMIVFTSARLDYVVYDQAARAALEKKYGRGNIPPAELKKIELRDGAQSKITAEWKAAAGDAENFDVRPMYRIPRIANHETIQKCAALGFAESIAYQAREVLKYAAKVESNDFNFSLRLIDETHNKRFFEAFGLFRGLSDDNNYDETETTAADQVMGIYHVQWSDGAGEYCDKTPADDPGIDDQFIGLHGLYRYKQNQIIGKYRTDRAAMVRAGSPAADLDRRRDMFRNELNNLWEGFRADKNDGAYIKALGFDYKRPPVRFSYDNFMFLNFRDPLRVDMLKEVYRSYLDKKLYSSSISENQKRIEDQECDF